MLGSTALVVGGALVALGAALWAGLLALAEEAAVGEALHTLGDAPPQTVGGRVPLHRAVHVSRLALLVLGAVGASRALVWWQQPWERSLLELAAAVGLLFVVGDALPRSIARLAPEVSTAALPLARRTLVPFGPLLWLLTWVDRGLHSLVAIPRPLQPDLGIAQRDMLLGVFTLADTTVDEVMTPRLDMVAVDVSATGEELLDTLHQSEHTRLPAYDGTPDNIAGVVYAKDLVPFVMGLGEGRDGGAARWQDLVGPALCVPETKTLDSQLREFQPGAAHLAIVVGEVGGGSRPRSSRSHDRLARGAARGARHRRRLGRGGRRDRRREPGRAHALGLVQTARRGGGRAPAGKPGPDARHRQRPHHAGHHLRRGLEPGPARPDHSDVPRRVHRDGGCAPVCERRLSGPPRGGPALGRADRGARGAVAGAPGAAPRGLHPVARSLGALHPRRRAFQRRHRCARLGRRDGGGVRRARLRGPPREGADDAADGHRGDPRGSPRRGGGPRVRAIGLH